MPPDAPEPLWRALAETALMLACLATLWPLMLWDGWVWYVLAGAAGLVLGCLLVRRIRRLRAGSVHELPPAALAPRGRKLSKAPDGPGA